MHPAAQLDEGSDVAADGDVAGGWVHYLGQDFEQGRLPGAVLADDPNRVTRRDLEIDVPERPAPWVAMTG